MKLCIPFSAWALALSLGIGSALAAIDEPARSKAELSAHSDGVGSLQMKKVNSAKVVAADYELIGHDFPAQAQRSGEDTDAWHRRVDEWLVRETGFISENQLGQTEVNTEIPTGDASKEAYSPKGYKRAAVIPVEGGLIDVKGSGHRDVPRQMHHGNGLATLGESIREYIYEKLVSNVLEDSGKNMKTVGAYAVLDYGFDVIHEDGTKDRAGAILRQAHVRADGINSMLPRESAIQVEETLRRYGLTGSGETYAFRHGSSAHSYQFDYVNIQGTNNSSAAEIVDFGAFLAVDKFEYDLTNGQGTVYRAKNNPGFVQPDPGKRVSLEQWGDFGTHDPKQDKPWQWSHELAKAIAEGRADRTAVNQHVSNMVGSYQQKIHYVPKNCGGFYRSLTQ